MLQVLQRLPLSHPALSIICTAGPSTHKFKKKGSSYEIAESKLGKLIDAGMGVVRINFSHVKSTQFEEIKFLIKHIRDLEKEKNIPISILMDLKGPEIRIEEIQTKTAHGKAKSHDFIKLQRGDEIKISADYHNNPEGIGDVSCRLLVSFEGTFYQEVLQGHTAVVGDNELYLGVKKKLDDGIICTAGSSGIIKKNKAINLPDRGALNVQSPVTQDITALMAGFDVDLIAQSFVQEVADVHRLIGRLVGTQLQDKPIIAKIETPSAVNEIDQILAVDQVFGIMVARGDLGVLADYMEIPQLQRRLINSANKLGKPVIVATQMLESMIERPRPWRPEVQDISTAIEEGADSLMLSGETASGQFAQESVEVMSAVIGKNVPVDRESYCRKFKGKFALPRQERPIDVIGHAICEVADEAESPFIFYYASTGISATLISRFRPSVPVIAITTSQRTARILTLLYNVYPVLVGDGSLPRETKEFIGFLKDINRKLMLTEKLKKENRQFFLVGTQELTPLINHQNNGPGGKARGIFVFEE